MNKLLFIIPLVIIVFSIIQLYPTNNDTLVLVPNLTANAYGPNGFYEYFEGRCDESCLTVPLDANINHGYSSSSNALVLLQQKGYEMVLDTALIFNYNYLKEFDTIIILHNEYVTQELFDSITNHPNVFYLYPNALYGEVEIEIVDGIPTMTLVKGHGVNGTNNAFDWEHENTRPDEFDKECLDYTWRVVSNGYQLNCYPENAILNNDSILQFIEDHK